MSLASTQFHSENDSLFTTDDQSSTNNFGNTTSNDNKIAIAAAAYGSHHDNDDDDDINDNLDYFIPSMEEFCMHTSSIYTPTNSSWFYLVEGGDGECGNGNDGSNSHHLTNLFCTPRSHVATESIESVIDKIPITLSRNIWAESSPIARSHVTKVDFQELQMQHEEQQIELQKQLLSQLQLGQEQCQHAQFCKERQLQKQKQQLDLFTQKYYRYAFKGEVTRPQPAMDMPQVVTMNSLPPLQSPIIANSLTTRQTNPQSLTFRTYSGSIFTVPSKSRFFVIKSYNILDVNASFEHKIWTSTELGNKRLDRAFHELQNTGNPEFDGKIFLFFSVNSLGKFCGVSQMKNCIDYNKTSDIWCEQTRWKGIFPVEWLLIKDVPNKFFQHLKIPANEFKPVTNSRDTQEVPFDIGISMLKIISSFRCNG